MATDIDVQYFSHLNGLTLSNNWGDLIRLLDKCLVNGLPLTSITSASIDAQGDITLNLYAAHNCMLFQIVELTGFTPSEINGKYRIKGTPSANQLILKATHVGKTIATTGAAKLASLGYEIIFRDTNDVKRVYRAKNPTAAHPFIRVDETISDGTNSYTSTYAKSAMVGLIENMTHIDDYLDPTKLQLPLDTADFSKNWKISGTGANVIRGWNKWYWTRSVEPQSLGSEVTTQGNSNRSFTLCGNKDAFYLLNTMTDNASYKVLMGCGLFESVMDSSIIPNWFLMAQPVLGIASSNISLTSLTGGTPLMYSPTANNFFIPKYSLSARISPHSIALPYLPDTTSGYSNLHAASNVPALTIPFGDNSAYLRGRLPHVCYAGKNMTGNLFTTAVLADNSMYVYDTAGTNSSGAKVGGLLFYLGEL